MNAKLSENKIPVVTRIADTEHVGSSCFNFAVNIFFYNNRLDVRHVHIRVCTGLYWLSKELVLL